MTSRRRMATFSFSPSVAESCNEDHVTINGKTALEHKLELLEARFTMPLDQQQQQQQPNGSNTNTSSPDTLGEDSSPASVHSQQQQQQHNQQHSQHSFGFDTPSLSYSNTHRPVTKEPEDNQQQQQQHVSGSRSGWQDVAAAHMAKVALQQQDESTVITSHVQPQRVKESPPFLSPKATASTTVRLELDNISADFFTIPFSHSLLF